MSEHRQVHITNAEAFWFGFWFAVGCFVVSALAFALIWMIMDQIKGHEIL